MIVSWIQPDFFQVFFFTYLNKMVFEIHQHCKAQMLGTKKTYI